MRNRQARRAALVSFVVLLLGVGVLGCKGDAGPEADGGNEPDARAADAASAQDAGEPRDAAAVDAAAPAACPDGTIVAGPTGCLQDDAFCRELPDGRYCTGPQRPRCPEGSSAIAREQACPPYTICWDYSPALRCARRAYTPEQCSAVGGIAVADPGDGSVTEGGCPADATALGPIDADWDEGGLCCTLGGVACGARAGDTCSDEQYCAYEAGELCGAADAQATCQPRPESCDTLYMPVCGCDGTSYSSACSAAAAGSGVRSSGECD